MSRTEIEAQIERLIDLLDRLDGDSDFEPSLADPFYRGSGTPLGSLDLEVDDSCFA